MHNFFESHACSKRNEHSQSSNHHFCKKKEGKKKTIIKKRKVQASILAVLRPHLFLNPGTANLCPFVWFQQTKKTPSCTCTMSTGSTMALAPADYEPGALPPTPPMRQENAQPPPAVPTPSVHSLPTPQTKLPIVAPLNWMPCKKNESRKLKTSHIASVFSTSNGKLIAFV